MHQPLPSARDVRLACRSGQLRGTTTGLAPGFIQANLVVLPETEASDFLLFCQSNPKPCPLIEVLSPGQFEPRCAPGADLRSDLPGYRTFVEGRAGDEVSDVADRWRDDFVSFLIGCSFSFEAALMAAGIRLRHIEEGINVAMYRTSLACEPVGRFHGQLVVSMRPIKASQIERVIEISSRFPQSHGAPLQVGSPEVLGIADLGRPDYGAAVRIEADEVPLFWACGVTPQAVIEDSGVSLCITHAPGKMFVTDLPSPH